MEDNLRPVIIVRRKKSGGHGGHHGGAWKIAYADFVTAMMAFFLLMWLLGSTTKGDLNGISEYFKTPLKVAMQGGSGSGDSSSVIKGGGTDLTRSSGQVKRGDDPNTQRTINLQAARAEFERQEVMQLEGLRRKIDSEVLSRETLKGFRNQVRLDLTREGLRIQIIDEQNRPMFDTGKAVLKDYTREILKHVGAALNSVNHKITLSGHTDAMPYSQGERGYSNWELSAERANASRRELVAAGISEAKIVRVVGLASSVPLDAADPMSPQNRRISIVVLNQKSEEALTRDLPRMEFDAKDGSFIEVTPAPAAKASTR
jgi:chemotaxis protein MotB